MEQKQALLNILEPLGFAFRDLEGWDDGFYIIHVEHDFERWYKLNSLPSPREVLDNLVSDARRDEMDGHRCW
jgi:hypothetical protein